MILIPAVLVKRFEVSYEHAVCLLGGLGRGDPLCFGLGGSGDS
jgi:hypothetical protein